MLLRKLSECISIQMVGNEDIGHRFCLAFRANFAHRSVLFEHTRVFFLFAHAAFNHFVLSVHAFSLTWSDRLSIGIYTKLATDKVGYSFVTK